MECIFQGAESKNCLEAQISSKMTGFGIDWGDVGTVRG